jgi:hypothetical protein
LLLQVFALDLFKVHLSFGCFPCFSYAKTFLSASWRIWIAIIITIKVSISASAVFQSNRALLRVFQHVLEISFYE